MHSRVAHDHLLGARGHDESTFLCSALAHVQIRESMKERTACWNGIFSLTQSGEVQIRPFLPLNSTNRHIMRGKKTEYILLTVSLLGNLNYDFIDTKIKLFLKGNLTCSEPSW